MCVTDVIRDHTVTLQEYHALLIGAQELALDALMLSVKGDRGQGLSAFMAQGSLNLAQQIKDAEQRLVRTDTV